jgi:hypothetical protein
LLSPQGPNRPGWNRYWQQSCSAWLTPTGHYV